MSARVNSPGKGMITGRSSSSSFSPRTNSVRRFVEFRHAFSNSSRVVSLERISIHCPNISSFHSIFRSAYAGQKTSIAVATSCSWSRAERVFSLGFQSSFSGGIDLAAFRMFSSWRSAWRQRSSIEFTGRLWRTVVCRGLTQILVTFC